MTPAHAAGRFCLCAGEDENAGAGTRTCGSRGGAQTKVCDGKLLVEGETPLLSTLVHWKSHEVIYRARHCLDAGAWSRIFVGRNNGLFFGGDTRYTRNYA